MGAYSCLSFRTICHKFSNMCFLITAVKTCYIDRNSMSEEVNEICNSFPPELRKQCTSFNDSTPLWNLANNLVQIWTALCFHSKFFLMRCFFSAGEMHKSMMAYLYIHTYFSFSAVPPRNQSSKDIPRNCFWESFCKDNVDILEKKKNLVLMCELTTTCNPPMAYNGINIY